MSTTTTTTCPGWCIVEHTWDGPEFHASEMSTIEAPTVATPLDDRLRVSLFQPVESDTAYVVVGGCTLTFGAARALADKLRTFTDPAEDVRQKVPGSSRGEHLDSNGG